MTKKTTTFKKAVVQKLERPDDYDSDVEGRDDTFPNDGYDYEQHFADMDVNNFIPATGQGEATDYHPVYGKDPKYWTEEERDMFAALGSDEELEAGDEADFQPLQFAAQQQVDTYELRWGKYTQEERYGNVDWGHGGVGEFDAGDFDAVEEVHARSANSGSGVESKKNKSKAPQSKGPQSQLGRSAAGSRYQRTFVGSKAATRAGRDFDKFTAITSKTVNAMRDEDREVLEKKFEDLRAEYADEEVGELDAERAKGMIPIDAMRSIFDAAFDEFVLEKLHSKRRNKKFDFTVNRMVKESEARDMEDEDEDDINWGKHKWQQGGKGEVIDEEQDEDEDEDEEQDEDQWEDEDFDGEEEGDYDEDEWDEDEDEEEQIVKPSAPAPVAKKPAALKKVEKANHKIFTGTLDDINWGEADNIDGKLMTAEELYGDESGLDALARKYEWDGEHSDLIGSEDWQSDDSLTDSEDEYEGLTEEEIEERRQAKATWLERALKIYQKKLKFDPLADMDDDLERAIRKQQKREAKRSMELEAAGEEEDIHFRRKRNAIWNKIKQGWQITIDDNTKAQILKFAEDHADDAIPDVDELVPTKEEDEEKLDCETILSTLSSAYNRPTKIGLPKGPKPKKLDLVGPHLTPVGVLPPSLAKAVGLGKHLADPSTGSSTSAAKKQPAVVGGMNKLAAILEGDSDDDEEQEDIQQEDVEGGDETDEDEEDEDEVQRVDPREIGRHSKEETAEEKKERKQAAKLLKQQARESKKEKKELQKEKKSMKKQFANNPYDIRSGMKAVRMN